MDKQKKTQKAAQKPATKNYRNTKIKKNKS